ncbi:TetR/AcrR family transcriptional regulator [uncultured Roseobacter sp.]|uniref:TetR/AcrR family transcriptional regulator n=1 Tax=uncultured Roseobacter sp. TaxID=114847 RepID=UPI002605F2B8|nr:TetR/AcrR family transcriptional regulator [uncultured Roseobacter sp.]
MSTDKPMSRRDRNLAGIRQKATELAERIVLEQGGDALHARGLAKELNISVGSLYNAFGDLDGVVRAVNARCADRLAEKLRIAARTEASDPVARINAIGEAYFDFAVAEPRRWYMLFERDSDLQLDLRTQELQEGLLNMLIRAGEGDPDDRQHREFYLMLWASVHGIVSLACRPSITMIDPGSARAYIRSLIRAAFRNFPETAPS